MKGISDMRTTIAAAVALGLSVATPVAADTPGRDWISSAKVKEVLAKRGFRVTSIEADDGHWEGEAWKARQKFEFHADPRSGAVTKLEPDRD